ncbi:MAG: nickel pincer cofactor biosynthesis protein LarC [candidate division WOR-3 bacterium]|nr:nickel pincer cofactor biosynthesis protein LarC [candidate division WOR-3 bacterium]MCX7837313.1 nickel pincer cofactor biosynthesis protein LarC [candidate division WOR-3 bacterium]
MKILYFDILSGISGDMVLSSLLNLLSKKEIEIFKKELSLLNLPIKFEIEKVKKREISAYQIKIKEDKKSFQPKDFIKIIEDSQLKEENKKLSLKILDSLIKAESKIHQEKKRYVHFHELGSYDTLLDICGVSILINMLKPERIYSSPVVLGRKKAFATLEILKEIPVYEIAYDYELTTPTGAAIIKNLCDNFSLLPLMKIYKIGYGAGYFDLEIPNILRVIYGELIEKENKIILLETNLDHLPPLIFENLFTQLFKNGALDVFITPILMKKMRPAYKLSCLIEEKDKEKIMKIIFSETETLGVRYYPVFRNILKREIKKIKTKYGMIRIKEAEVEGKVIKNWEYEDIKRIAQKRKIPLIKIYKELSEYLK